MRVAHVEEIPAAAVDMEGAKGVRIRIAVGEPQGAPNFIMRVFDLEPGGHSPLHSHPFEHEVFVLSGQGSHLDGEKEGRLQPGDVVYVAPGALHQFRAAAEEGMRFICVVPKS